MNPAPERSPASNFTSVHVHSESVKETLEFGEQLAHILQGGDILALTGDLGAGKTLITQGIACGLGISTEQVTSPTFTLIQSYEEGRIPVIHIDLYRLENPAAILQLGLEDYFTPRNVVIIEWADRLIQLLPSDHLSLHLEHGDTETRRRLTIRGTGPRSTDIMTSLKHSNMVDHSPTNPSHKN